MKIFIDNKEADVLPGETLIETARRVGVAVPSLCYAKNAEHKSSCMVCAVRNSDNGQIIPSCTTLPVEGMRIETDNPEVRLSRTLSLELLLSDHRADCEAPCGVACPGNMDVAAMNRLYDEGQLDEALTLLRDTLVIPATLCFICNAPCEKICRRGAVNKPVPIREIKKILVAATDLDAIAPPAVRNGMKIAVTGADPAALAAAYHLCKQGYEVTLFEPSGQMLAPYIQAENVPGDILELETEVIRRMGVELRHTAELPSSGDFDGIVPQTKQRQPARMALEGRRMAENMHASLSTGSTLREGEAKVFSSTYSRFTDAEKKRLGELPHTKTSCLYCDCEGKITCSLRRYATEYGVKNTRYAKEGTLEALHRRKIGENIRFEPAKCIKCGLCVYNSHNGFTFKGRGFVMQVMLPEGNEMNITEKVTELCPTSALYCV
ncbi:MAG: (2Fe-2S)-binding protein [Prevotellaceae bacterium]|jgi:predicted molibdopterin-dependent oxidoreductase YjgC|nr:(2Fe-2S)-binding protein [Prevotellaceae bacterium]